MPKKPTTSDKPLSHYVKHAAEARSACNNLNDTQREKLVDKALAYIYGNRDKAAVSRRG